MSCPDTWLGAHGNKTHSARRMELRCPVRPPIPVHVQVCGLWAGMSLMCQPQHGLTSSIVASRSRALSNRHPSHESPVSFPILSDSYPMQCAALDETVCVLQDARSCCGHCSGRARLIAAPAIVRRCRWRRISRRVASLALRGVPHAKLREAHETHLGLGRHV